MSDLTAKMLALPPHAHARMVWALNEAERVCENESMGDGPETYAAIRAALRALWAVRVLDRWALSSKRRNVPAPSRYKGAPSSVTAEWFCAPTPGTCGFGPTPDAARIAAAEALVADDPTLGEGLS